MVGGFNPPALPALPAPPAPRLLSPRNPSNLQCARSGGRDAAAAAAERYELDGFEVNERLVVVGNRLDFGRAGERQIALGLEHEERLSHARRHLLLLRFELLFL